MKVKVQGHTGNQSSQDRIPGRRELLRERTQRPTEGLLLTPSRVTVCACEERPEGGTEPPKRTSGNSASFRQSDLKTHHAHGTG